jgi:hypothetical protein
MGPSWTAVRAYASLAAFRVRPRMATRQVATSAIRRTYSINA